MKRPARSYGISFLGAALALACSSCGSGGSNGSAQHGGSELRIVTATGGPLVAIAGDALALKVVQVSTDGSVSDLPPSAQVTWTSPDVFSAYPPNTQAPDIVSLAASSPGAPPTAAWIDNAARTDHGADMASVLFVVDPGTLQNAALRVSATVSGVGRDGDVEAAISVSPTPLGDWTRGKALYGASGANCAQCHGVSGHGSTGTAPYVMDGQGYEYPAPGINAEPGNLASDPSWNSALFAFAARADVDNHGVALRVPMPDWLAMPNPTSGQPLTTQDFADIYAFLKTETQ